MRVTMGRHVEFELLSCRVACLSVCHSLVRCTLVRTLGKAGLSGTVHSFADRQASSTRLQRAVKPNAQASSENVYGRRSTSTYRGYREKTSPSTTTVPTGTDWLRSRRLDGS